mgnify:CR=1 FL=1
MYRDALRGADEYLNQQLEGKSFLMGDAFSLPDAYLFTVTNWAKPVGVDITDLSNVQSLHGAHGREALQCKRRLKAEGLLK